MTNSKHLIAKQDLRRTTWLDATPAPLAKGDVRLKLDAFALTANNVTYAATGGAPLYYWNFFPCEDEAMGQVPVWGFATIIDSQADGIAPGRRVYGYFPISETLDVTPARLSDKGFFDAAPHRAELSPVYNAYLFTDTDPSYVADYEAQQMLFRPLYLTGWMICDSLVAGDVKIDTAIISSASSKTALATAHGSKARGIRTIGLTSEGNKSFVEQSGLYDETLTYDEVAQLSPGASAAYVDFAGRPALTLAVHQACGEALKRSLIIGLTDWEADRTPPADLPGPRPEFFFAPAYLAKRAKELPSGELNRQMNDDLVDFYPISVKFVTPQGVTGREAIAAAWLKTVDGKVSPKQGLICSF